MSVANIDTNNVVLAFIALMNVITAFMAYKTHHLTRQVELATNSMKDALVKATGDARFAEGQEAGKASEKASREGQ